MRLCVLPNCGIGGAAQLDGTDVNGSGKKVCKIRGEPRRKVLVNEKLQGP